MTEQSGQAATQHKSAIVQMLCVIVETVAESGPLGAPAGPMYAALMSIGITLERFEQLMGGLVKVGALTKSGHCYHITELGRDFISKARG